MKPLAAIALLIVLAGCSTLRNDDAPGCSGARRPANPHGSVLAPSEAAPAPAGHAGGDGLCAGGQP